MVAVFNKELLSWYLITVKLREAVESGVATTSAGFPEQAQRQLQKQQQQPSESLQIVIRNDVKNCEEEDNPPESEWLGNPDQKGVVAKLTLQFFDPLMPTDEPLTKSDMNKLELSLGYATTFDPLSDQGGLHCLDVFRRSLLRRGPQPEPRIWIKRWSHGNRVADKRRHNDITSYVVFMDNLINSHQDVGYLHYCGIIEHWLGSDAEVADLFNRLCQEVVFDINNSYLSRLSEDVNRYYNHRWNAWRASLKHNYFGNPWAIVSLIAAVVLLLLTFAQTFYGVYGYYNPR
ncbi:hypothetical protein FH972_004054 [Carpinus fangiana]|uniref:Uncharacterized protein n=1 Tax=Carpinus fangiana TaxID=176857 RepID=A0A5N6QK50_9ROSI|nr:hypothetical protein FH972_004054 [Carpinus fangiana]